MLWFFLIALVVLSVVAVVRLIRLQQGVTLLRSLHAVAVREERAPDARGEFYTRFPMVWRVLGVEDLLRVRNELMYYGSEAAVAGDEEAVADIKRQIAYVDQLIDEA